MNNQLIAALKYLRLGGLLTHWDEYLKQAAQGRFSQKGEKGVSSINIILIGRRGWRRQQIRGDFQKLSFQSVLPCDESREQEYDID